MPERTAKSNLEHTLLIGVVVVRTLGLVATALPALGARRSLGRPRMLVAAVGVATTSSMLGSVASVRRRRIDGPVPLLSDLVSVAAVVQGERFAGKFATTDKGSRQLMQFAYDLAPVAVASRSTVTRGALALATLATAFVPLRGSASDYAQPTDLVADLLNLFLISLPAAWFVRGVREQAAILDERREVLARIAGELSAAEERHSYERLLHDSALQIFEAVSKGWEPDAGVLLNQIDLELARLRNVVAGTSSFSTGVISKRFDDLTQEFASVGLAIHVTVSSGLENLKSSVAEALVEGAREAVRNILKHSGVFKAEIAVCRVGSVVEVSVCDNGQGFDPSSDTSGHGLRHSLVGRILQVGGTVDIESALGEGTTVRMKVPLDTNRDYRRPPRLPFRAGWSTRSR